MGSTTKEEYASRRSAWLAALRSGDYVKGVDTLHSEQEGKESFCCLGVACDILDLRDFGVTVTTEPTSTPDRTVFQYSGCNSFLPYAIRVYYGFRSVGGKLLGARAASLAELNDSGEDEDGRGWSFQEIADYVTNYPERVWQEGTY